MQEQGERGGQCWNVIGHPYQMQNDHLLQRETKQPQPLLLEIKK